MIRMAYISYIIIKNFPHIDLNFFSCTEFECISVKKSSAEIESPR